MDRGAWWAAVHRVAQRLKRLSMHACIVEGNSNPLQYSCLENPRDRISLLRALVKDLFLATSVLLLRLYLPIASPKIHNTNTTKLILTCISLLSHFSRIQLCATPSTAAHQAPPSLGFSRQEYWSGLPFPSPMHESEKSK